MLFQWYLFAFLILLYLIAKVGNQSYRVYAAGQYEKRYKWFTAIMVIAVLTYTAATRHEYFGDTWAYVRGFQLTGNTWQDIVSVFEMDVKDKGFQVLNVILKMLLGNRYRAYLGVIAGFCLVCVISVYRRHSCNFFMTIFLFLASGEYVQWTHNGMRQFVAVAIIFAGTDLLLQKKYTQYIALVLFASTFHASALVMVPTILVVQGRAWNVKSIAMMLGIMVLASVNGLLNEILVSVMENSQYAGAVDSMLATGGTNGLRVLVFAIPPVMALIFRRRILQMDIPLINLAVNMSVVSLGMYVISMFTSGIYMGRMPVYFSLYNYILLPWIIERFFEKASSRLIYLCAMGCYMIYYYYQMHVVWSGATSL